jgi:endonuclease I
MFKFTHFPRPRSLGPVIVGILALHSAIAQWNAPDGYYDPIEDLEGDQLRSALHDVIDGHRNLGYGAARTALRTLDRDPENENNILLIYSGESVEGFRFNTLWNREHLWPQSYGADSDTIPGADLHHLYPADPGVNSARSNYIFDVTNPSDVRTNPKAPGSSYDSNSWEPRDADKGKVARAMLYMDVRYDGSDSPDFVLAESANQSTTRFAKLSTLLDWNRQFPPTEEEKRRNHLIHTGFSFGTFTYDQGNRNPFVDLPDLGDVLFGPDGIILWGTWRWAYFSIDQLVEQAQTGDLDDPDEDYRLNLVEFSANTDPVTPDETQILEVTSFGGLATQLRYNRLSGFESSGLTYELQASSTPLRQETWQTITEFSNEIVLEQGETEQVSAVILPDPSAHYRLKVSREQTPTETVSAVFDPTLAAHPEIADSLFVYDDKLPGSEYKESDWMGFVIDDDWPWVYSYEHRWQFYAATRDDNVWFFDSLLGWLYTQSAVYPYIYIQNSEEWFYFLQGSLAPERWFYTDSTDWIQEADLFAPTL